MKPLMENNLQHSFTLSIDWEDFGQLLGRDRTGIITQPKPYTIDRQTDIILQMLNETDRKATFFILGMLAQYRPDLVKKIAAEGHEVALHGNNHLNKRKLNRQEVLKSLGDTQKLVTDIIGAPVYGFRAPYFSIDDTNLFVLEVLSELGLIYDSSIFPIKLKRYGIANFSKADALYKLPNGKEIVELPLTVAPVYGKYLPVAGGGYIRALPKFYLNRIFRKLNENGKNVMLYMHPYEFDTKRIDCSTNYPEDFVHSRIKTALINLRWNLFRQTIRGKLKSLLKQYQFTTCLNKANYVKNNSHSPAVLGRS
jgi:polysaccharide deacetylase family protein (PEP-CTERM system associated)